MKLETRDIFFNIQEKKDEIIKSKLGWQRKKIQVQGAQNLRSETY
jgi:hypothetical protein